MFHATIGQLICHLVGDYVIQNHWMANAKTRSSFAAVAHALSYTLPFLFLTHNPTALGVICGTHFVIDRWRIARLWVEFWGVGCEGWVPRKVREWRRERAVLREEVFRFNIIGPPPSQKAIEAIWAEFPAPEPAPAFLAVWLLIIVDNTAHLAINAFALSL